MGNAWSEAVAKTLIGSFHCKKYLKTKSEVQDANKVFGKFKYNKRDSKDISVYISDKLGI